MVQPPFVENVHIPIPPFVRVDLAYIILKNRKIVPVVAIAEDFTGIVVIVIRVGIGRKMDISDLGLSRRGLIIKRKLGVQVGGPLCSGKRLGQNGFDPVAKRVQHLPHAALGGKTHHNESPAATN